MGSEASEEIKTIQPDQIALNFHGRGYIHGVPPNLTTGVELNVHKVGCRFQLNRPAGSVPDIQPTREELDPKPDSNAMSGFVWVGMTPSEQTLSLKADKDAAAHDMIDTANDHTQQEPQATPSKSAKQNPGKGRCTKPVTLHPIKHDANAFRVVVNKASKHLQFYKLVFRDPGTSLCYKESVPQENVFFFPAFLSPEARTQKARKNALNQKLNKIATGVGSAVTPKNKKPAAAAPPPVQAPKTQKVDSMNAPRPPKRTAEASGRPATIERGQVLQENCNPIKPSDGNHSGGAGTRAAQGSKGLSVDEEVAQKLAIDGFRPLSSAPSATPAHKKAEGFRRSQAGNATPSQKTPPARHVHRTQAASSTGSVSTDTAHRGIPAEPPVNRTPWVAPTTDKGFDARAYPPPFDLPPHHQARSGTDKSLDATAYRNSFGLSHSWAQATHQEATFGIPAPRPQVGMITDMIPSATANQGDSMNYPPVTPIFDRTPDATAFSPPTGCDQNGRSLSPDYSVTPCPPRPSKSPLNQTASPASTDEGLRPTTTSYPYDGAHYGDASPSPSHVAAASSRLSSKGFYNPERDAITGFPPSFETSDDWYPPRQRDIRPKLMVQGGSIHRQTPHRRQLPGQHTRNKLGLPARQEALTDRRHDHASLTRPLSRSGVSKPRMNPSAGMTKKLMALAVELEKESKFPVIEQLIAIAEDIQRGDLAVNDKGCLGAHFKCPSEKITIQTITPMFEQLMKMFPDLQQGEDINIKEFGFMLHGMRELDIMIEYRHIRQFIYAFVIEVRGRLESDAEFARLFRLDVKMLRGDAMSMVMTAQNSARSLLPSRYDKEDSDTADSDN